MKQLLEKAQDLCATAKIKIEKADAQRAEQDAFQISLNTREETIKAEEARLKDAGILEKSVQWVNDQIAELNQKSEEFNNGKIVWEREKLAKEKELADLIAKNLEMQGQYEGKLKDLQESREALNEDKKTYQAKVIAEVNKKLKLKGFEL